MVIAGSNTTSIRAVDAANSRPRTSHRFRFTFSMVVAVLNSIKLVAFLFQLNINGELDRES